jgi:uncharacterized membrane protein (UPF0136 family)
MNITPSLVLWIYVGLLLIGGFIGYLKAKSQVSLITSLAFAAALALCALEIVFKSGMAYVFLGLLLVVFCIRFMKTKKFMPSGMLMAVTLLTLIVYAVVAGK